MLAVQARAQNLTSIRGRQVMTRSPQRWIPRATRTQLKSTTVLPIVLGIGIGMAGLGGLSICAVRPAKAVPVARGLPEAIPNGIRTVACNPCNPCAAAANPCNPCAAANPCNPCAAAANPCSPCNPCAAEAAGATNCVVPRLQLAAANPCNPCAAASPCNPCAAAANPCNPCAAASPCNPCAAGEVVELTDGEAATVYDCVRAFMQAAYAAADHPAAGRFLDWKAYSLVPYQSATHGSRYVMNYANAKGAAYGRYEEAGTLPVGSVAAKNSFVPGPDGHVAVGPLFLMEKMAAGFDPEGGDWRYTMIMPDGSTFGTTGGQNAAGVAFCNDCHAIMAEDADWLYFLPEEYRTVKR
jgi:hypothetical protein